MTDDQQTQKGSSVTSGATKSNSKRRVAIVLALLTLFGSPTLALYSKYSFMNVDTFVGDWGDMALFLLAGLACFSIYELVSERSTEEGEKSKQVIDHSTQLLFKYKHITIPVFVIFVFATLSWLSGAPYLGILLSYSIVIILGLISLFHASFKFWPQQLKTNKRIQSGLFVLLIIVGLFTSFGIQFLAVPIITLVFVGIVFIGGIGTVTIIDTIGSEVSHVADAQKKVHYIYPFVILAILIPLLIMATDYVYSFPIGPTALSSVSQELSTLQAGVLFSYYFVFLALVLGGVYFVFSVFRKRMFQNVSRFLYLVVVVAIAGSLISYIDGYVAVDWNSAVSPNLLSNFVIGAIPSFILFAIGYTQLLLELPKRASTKMQLEEDKFAVAITYLIIFSAISEFMSWALYGKPGFFLAEVDLVQWVALPVGAIIIGISKWNLHKQKILNTS
ncbi:MAG: hypothetical protein JRN52_09490 [Nitrososphaerota archaeon]|nr:hypothetical protein [Nitrososphaerota archaeon]